MVPSTSSTTRVLAPFAAVMCLVAWASSGQLAARVKPAEFGGYLRPGNAVSGWFAGAVKRIRAEDAKAAAEAKARGEETPPIMPRMTPHDLRHTAASLAISAGANVKAVQRMLGHASAAMTLDTYAELFEDDLDSVAVALDSQRSESLAS